MKRIGLWLLAVLVTQGTGSAEGGRRFALLVGINNYDSAEITDLRFAVNDVTTLAKGLTATAPLGFQAENVFLMTDQTTDDAYRPKQTNILVRFDMLKSQVKPEDLLLFYFAGHGLESGGEYYLLTQDSDIRTKSALERSALRLSDVRKLLDEVPCAERLLFFDACRDDPRAEGRAAGGAPNVLSEVFVRGMRPRALEAVPETVTRPRLTATFYATQQGQRSYEWPARSQGFFSYYLVQGLRGEAAQPDGKVTLNSLEAYLSQAVPASTRREINQLQTPWVDRSSAGGAELVLGRFPPRNIDKVTATATLRVRARPDGAVVILDGEMVGVTPCEAEVDLLGQQERTVEVAVTRQGFRTETRRVSLTRGQMAELELGELVKRPIRQAVTGTLKITSDPPGATVVLNGVEVGRTPYEDTFVPAGGQRVNLLMAGKSMVERQVKVEPGKVCELTIKLEAQPATLIIDSTPPGAKVKVNGELKGEAPLTVGQLPPGEYTVELTLDGFEAQKQTVGLAPAAVVPIRAILIPKQQGEALNDPVFDKPVTVAARGESVRAVIARLAADVGVNMVVDDAVAARPVSLNLREVPLRSALRVLSVTYGLQLVRQGEVYQVVPKEAEFTGGTVVKQGTAELVVESEPPGATVELDGQAIGVTPLRHVLELPTGKQKGAFVTVTLAGHRGLVTWVRLSSGRATHVGTLVLPEGGDLAAVMATRPDAAELLIRSDPDGARVELDGRAIGQTPLRHFIPLLADSLTPVTLRLVKEGYQEVRTSVRLKLGQVINVGTLLLPPLRPAAVEVTSEPSEATVSIDGQEVGKTPYSGTVPVTDVSGRKQIKIEVVKAGFLTSTHTAEVVSGGKLSWKAVLEKGVKVSIRTKPGLAYVSVKGQRLGLTPWTGRVVGTGEFLDLECESMVSGLKVKGQVELTDGAEAVLELPLLEDRSGITKRGWKPAENLVWDIAKDGGPMVWIPPGTFTMGEAQDSDGRSDNSPARQIQLSGYWIQVTEVTNNQFTSWLKSSNRRFYRSSSYGVANGPDYPAVDVPWLTARQYAQSHGLNLPTEAQWEKAARGGTENQPYPWGPVWDANQARAGGALTGSRRVRGYLGYPTVDYYAIQCTAVATYPPNPYGLFDLIGNAQEWCLDIYDAQAYATLPARDPCVLQPAKNVGWYGTPSYVLRGGCWSLSGDSDLTVVARAADDGGSVYGGRVGFRCVLGPFDAEGNKLPEPAVPAGAATTPGLTAPGASGVPGMPGMGVPKR